MIKRGTDIMLSRVADSLYWMSRYLERAQHTARLLDVTLDLLPERTSGAADRSWVKLFESLGLVLPKGLVSPMDYMQRLAFDTEDSNSIASSINAARENARQVREEVSSEMWEQINRLYLKVSTSDIHSVWEAQPHAFLQDVKQAIHLFEGVTDSTMNRGQGWQFIKVGQFLERAGNIARLLDVHLQDLDFDMMNQSLDSYQNTVCLLRSCTAWEAYCKVYSADTQVPAIVEFLLLDEEFPHAIHFSIRRMRNALLFIAEGAEKEKNTSIPVLRAVGRLKAMLEYGIIDEIIEENLHKVLLEIRNQCSQIHVLLHQHYIAYPVEDKMLL